ncbi:MAG: 4-alpha-glucanotransferase [Candidatus Azobacteroides sp.]|nr:4-alpha-glucanotransferase [Candidatus Azobacteroides sp.]
MKIKFNITYNTKWGQSVCVCGSVPELGLWEEKNAIDLHFVYPSTWVLEVDINKSEKIEYRYFLKENGNVIHREWGEPHCLQPDNKKSFFVTDSWIESPQQNFLFTSGFTESFFYHPIQNKKIRYFKNSVLLNVFCPYIEKNQTLFIVGSSDKLGNWIPANGLELTPVGTAQWQLLINTDQIDKGSEYKFVIYDKHQQKVIHWEEGNNRELTPAKDSKESPGIVWVESLIYNYGHSNWKAAGVAIPVFSLRSEKSSGIGEFPDLKPMVDWANKTGQKIIQILPINDTTITYTWTDSYPYNAISIYALHPIYFGLKEYPLKDKALREQYEKLAGHLNDLKEIDYEKVLSLKNAYLQDLFNEIGTDTLKSKKFLEFYEKNEEWLFPYACFTYFRDKYHTAAYTRWETFKKYDKTALTELAGEDKEFKDKLDKAFFTQYLLHEQLYNVKMYAHEKDVVLKGDIPIGISRNSVEAWVEPHLFNLDTQTGAPPDDFSITGQNWGFPTYNWNEMAKDGYQWWRKRFVKMTDYFDIYRIDHILGFFRIWEIPINSVQGLLGYFSPALPFTIQEINNAGIYFDEYRMTKPYIHEHFLGEIFGEYTQEVIGKFLRTVAWQRYELNEICNDQQKIKALFLGEEDEKSIRIRDGLYSLCNEVLFIRDKREPDKFHPRITAQFTFSYKDLDDNTKSAFNKLYDYFFYNRHSEFWRLEALKKLPPLISSTHMLVCGEDLGMVPDCVPSVMHELQILSLEIERMPKDPMVEFNSLPYLPYMSVCTTSTHDMSHIRLWWKENREITQKYYNQVLWKPGIAPEECSSELCWQIITNHLNAPSMLTILPLQDWLSIDDALKRPNPEEERINIPANPQHYWRYRMHLTLEELLGKTEYNDQIRNMVRLSGRE